MIRFFTCSAVFILALLQIVFSAEAENKPAAEDAKKPAVSLVLNSVVVRSDNSETVFRCNTTLINNTGSDIIITSNFFSVFDIVTIVVTSSDGKRLKHQSYIYHQSPFTSEGRELKLKKGETKADLVFPIDKIGRIGQTVNVQLIGVASAAGTNVNLRSKTKEIVIKKAK